jgi:hypothetical protein
LIQCPSAAGMKEEGPDRRREPYQARRLVQVQTPQVRGRAAENAGDDV